MLEVRDLRVTVGSFVLEDFSLEVAVGECVALMGPSGCGKTTVVEAICGLREEMTGEILLDGELVSGLAAGERGIGLVPQDVVLFPALTVRGHLEFAPRVRGWSGAEIRGRVEMLAEGLGLTPLLDRLPRELSGGQARRVALGRALAARPRLLCLDEALSGLDSKTHAEVLEMLRALIREEEVAVLHVTHAPEEAAAIADRIVSM